MRIEGFSQFRGGVPKGLEELLSQEEGPAVAKANPVNLIVSGGTTIPVEDPAMREALAPLDTNGDGQIDVDDVTLTNDKMPCALKRQDRILHYAISHVLERSGYLTPQQRSGFERFLQLSFDVSHANWIVRREWNSYNTDRWGREMEFNAYAWREKVLPYIVGDGVLSPHGPRSNPYGAYAAASAHGKIGLGLSAELYATLTALQDLKGQGNPFIAGGRMASSILYDPERIPAFLAEPVNALITDWRQLRSFFDGAQDDLFARYTQIECEGEGCPANDEYGVFFAEITEGPIVERKRTSCGVWVRFGYVPWTCPEEGVDH